jgi:retron-type reverse transcriptase
MIPHNEIFISKIDKNKVKDFSKLFKPFESSISNSVVSDFLGKLFKNSDKTNKETLNSIEILLNESLKLFGIDYINEYACAVAMVPILLGFSKYNITSDFKNEIYSLEKYMRVRKIARKCDAIYKYGNILFIIEYKMNIHHKQCALEYIGDQNYVKHVLEYLLINERDVLEGITEIGQIGILFYKD